MTALSILHTNSCCFVLLRHWHFRVSKAHIPTSCVLAMKKSRLWTRRGLCVRKCQVRTSRGVLPNTCFVHSSFHLSEAFSSLTSAQCQDLKLCSFVCAFVRMRGRVSVDESAHRCISDMCHAWSRRHGPLPQHVFAIWQRQFLRQESVSEHSLQS